RFIVTVTEESVVRDIRVPSPPSRRVWNTGRRTMVMAVVSVLLLCLGLLGMRWLTGVQTGEAKPVVLSVLPLQDLSEDSSAGSLGDGLGDELTVQLGRADPAKLAVTSRAAAQAYRYTNKTVAEVARDLRSAYLLEGNIRGDTG